MSNKSTVGTTIVWSLIRCTATAVVILLMIPYVSGWLTVAAWIIFAWQALDVLASLVAIGTSFNRISTATRRARLRGTR